MLAHDDTIAAIATPPGVGGIGIVRVSGPNAGDICRALFKSPVAKGFLQSHHLYHGDIISPETGRVIDEVLIALMRGPHSYTGEDVLEIHCHGGHLIPLVVLNEVIKAGGRPAQPGEFTKRAYLNGRMDLSQAEAVMELIAARTDRGRALAIFGLKGKLSEQLQSIRSDLIGILSSLESTIDFNEEDISPSPGPDRTLPDDMDDIITRITSLLATYREGKLFRDGLTAVITGRPNVGKSSLLNILLGERRAIVTPIPGTTRDFIEETINIKGILVTLTDTAGVRKSGEAIEQEGIAFVWEKVLAADMVIILIDGSVPLTEEDVEVIDRNRGKRVVLAVNKSDLPHRVTGAQLDELIPGVKPLWISAKYGDGIDELKERIYTTALDGGEGSATDVILTNLRHKNALEKTAASLATAHASLSSGDSPELAAFDVKEALDHLGDIVGGTTAEDVLDRIFSTFCVGK
ncbi:MAG: tRNA uridine-5-carboxymethylaminomethyl(34) synthesis GTPase MnmE [Syntrophales bacterium]|nr:tRNA uridine-5-carboxymethylaminomethyl(34) synthesis GTPase MnmE [Syntrophales bacterium]